MRYDKEWLANKGLSIAGKATDLESKDPMCTTSQPS